MGKYFFGVDFFLKTSDCLMNRRLPEIFVIKKIKGIPRVRPLLYEREHYCVCFAVVGITAMIS